VDTYGRPYQLQNRSVSKSVARFPLFHSKSESRQVKQSLREPITTIAWTNAKDCIEQIKDAIVQELKKDPPQIDLSSFHIKIIYKNLSHISAIRSLIRGYQHRNQQSQQDQKNQAQKARSSKNKLVKLHKHLLLLNDYEEFLELCNNLHNNIERYMICLSYKTLQKMDQQTSKGTQQKPRTYEIRPLLRFLQRFLPWITRWLSSNLEYRARMEQYCHSFPSVRYFPCLEYLMHILKKSYTLSDSDQHLQGDILDSYQKDFMTVIMMCIQEGARYPEQMEMIILCVSFLFDNLYIAR
jgi:hypothetical protein